MTSTQAAVSSRTIPAWLTGMFAAVDAFDIETFLTFLAPNCEFRFANNPAVYGPEPVREILTGMFSALKGISHAELEAWETPDATICSGRVTYVRLDGSELSVPFAVIFRLDGGLVRQYLIYVDNSQLFA